jgi:hypothetical protein
VGEKIHVLWAKGKTYAGVVKEYNAVSGPPEAMPACTRSLPKYGSEPSCCLQESQKHRVRYDDGSDKW